jgi:hypothetical protein
VFIKAWQCNGKAEQGEASLSEGRAMQRSEIRGLARALLGGTLLGKAESCEGVALL